MFRPEHVALLLERLGDAIRRLPSLGREDRCRVLLCLADLGIATGTVAAHVERVVQDRPTEDEETPLIIYTCLRQLVLFRFGVAESDRADFLYRWVCGGRCRGEDPVAKTFILGLALEQDRLYGGKPAEAASEWFLRNRKTIKSWRARAWLPRYLELAGATKEAHESAEAMLRGRDGKGTWREDFRSTVGITYALLHSGIVGQERLAATLTYLDGKLTRGPAGTLSVDSDLLKIASKIGDLEQEHLLRVSAELGPLPVENLKTAMDKLLLELFDPPDLRRWVSRMPGGTALTNDLPAESSLSPAAVAAAVVDGLLKRGMIDWSFFDRLSEARPGRRSDIAAVALTWQLTCPPARSLAST